MDPYIQAQVQALRQVLLALEGVLATPIGLAHDLRGLRRSLPGEDEGSAPRPRLSLSQAAEALAAASSLVQHLSALGALDPSWTERARRVLPRAEMRLGREVRRPLRERIRGVYVILDPSATGGRDPLQVAEAALRGGARVLQWRDKRGEKGDQLATARRLADLCRRYEALFLVNDHVDLALAAEAHGVHLGQHDLPPAEARRCLPPDRLVGRSNATLEEALDSEALGADYVAVGAIYPTASKEPERTRHAGLETLRRVKEAVGVPVVAIGGITPENAAEAVRAGADALAVIRAVCAAPDPAEAVRALADAIRSAGGQA